eukprot:gene19719-23622_t
MIEIATTTTTTSLYAFTLGVVVVSQRLVTEIDTVSPATALVTQTAHMREITMLEGLNYTYTDCISIINLRQEFLDKLWDLFAYMMHVVQTDKYSVTEDKWLTLSKEFGNNYLTMFNGVQLTSYLHTLIYHTGYFIHKYGCLFKYANFGIECRHKIIKKLIKASNHHFNYKLYRDILVQCYNWRGNDTSTYVSNHKWTASEVKPPVHVYIARKQYRTIGGTGSYFHLKKSSQL